MSLDFIMIPVVVGTITLGIYKLFELFARRRERIILVEKLDASQITGFDAGRLSMPTSLPTSGALSIGCLLVGLGLGLLVGYFICAVSGAYRYGDIDANQVQYYGVVYGGSILFFGGAGLVAAFIIGRKLAKKKD